MKSPVLHTVRCCNAVGEAAGEIWNWSLLGVKGLKCWAHPFPLPPPSPVLSPPPPPPTAPPCSPAGGPHESLLLRLPVPPSFVKTPDRASHVRQQTTVSLPCKTLAYPAASTTWMKAFSSLPKGRSTVLSNGTLVITDFQAEDAGTYMCRASNELGSVSFVISVSSVYPGKLPHRR